MNSIYALLGIFVAWSLWGYLGSRVEKTEYSVIDTKNAYEVRLYPEHIVAQTVVSGPYSDAMNQGFRIVAGYIFGGNAKQQSIAMTAPVVAAIEGESHTVTFGMPRAQTLETLPQPKDSRVEIVTVPAKKMAVVQFSWTRSESRVQSKKRALLDALQQDGVTVVGDPYYVGYNAPWTPLWMTRNEVLVEIK